MNTSTLSTKAAAQIPMVPGSNLDAYLTVIHSIPNMSAEEERRLSERLVEHNDMDAARQLVTSQLRFVVHIARSYSGYGLPLSDLIQEGNIGLIKAVKRFNPAAQVRLITFGVHWIRAEINEFIIRNGRMVRLATTKAQRKLFFNLRKQPRSRNWLTADETRHIADTLNVSVLDVKEMETRMAGNDTSFDPAADADDESAYLTPAHQIGDHRYDPAHQYESEADTSIDDLHEALNSLDERSRDILAQRFLSESKATLHDLASKYNVSAERIRQIEKLALAKLKVAIPLAA
ncbi:RNA polymerase sigma factor RpoH [Pseudomonas baetica]|uniref:RNA polymerase sigma factor RpoH n=1 Tax=Pseudomonas fluorescens group TaxID=136843 RepID=UPI001C8B8653|nr:MULTISPECIES: RNA polymerase sigma factor RpoH [Pseudomonas fluorescens group]MBX9405540.1 RNA polymerase sigma factor RpoH [Pseudomonas baetica]